MGLYDISDSGGMLSYRRADSIYLNNGLAFSREDEVIGDELIGYDGAIDGIEVRVRAPQLVDIRFIISDESDTYVREVLHCGTFTIIWEL